MNGENFDKVESILDSKALEEYKKEVKVKVLEEYKKEYKKKLLGLYEGKLVEEFGEEMKGKLTGLFSEEKVEKVEKIKLEPENLKIDSSSWEEVVNKEGFTELVNPEGDVWEYKGNQYFTWDAAMREAKKLGKRLPTDEEMKKLEKEDYGEVEYIGYRYTDGSFGGLGAGEDFWSSTESGTGAWKRHLNSSSTTVGRNTNDKSNGFGLRCLKN